VTAYRRKLAVSTHQQTYWRLFAKQTPKGSEQFKLSDMNDGNK